MKQNYPINDSSPLIDPEPIMDNDSLNLGYTPTLLKDHDRDSNNYSTNNEETPLTVSGIIDTIGYGPFQTRLIFVCGLIYVADALEIVLLSFLVPKLQDEWSISDSDSGLLSGIVFIGMMFGALGWGIFADTFGRKKALIAAVGLCFLFGIGSAFATDFYFLLFFRFIVGIGVAGTHNAFSLFMEFLPSTSRGKLINLFALFWSAGVCFMSVIAWICLTFSTWRVMLIISSLPVLLSLSLIPCYVPESPHYLMLKDQQEEAAIIIQRVAHVNNYILSGPLKLKAHGHSTKDQVDSEMDENDEENSERKQKSFIQPFIELFSPSLYKITLIMWIIWAADSITYYGATFVTPRLFANQSLYFSTLITALGEVPGNLISSLYLIDKWGRSKTISSGFVVVALFCPILAVAQFFAPSDTSSSLYNFSFSVQLFSMFMARMGATVAFNVSYVYTPEVYPTSNRATGLGSCSAISRIAGFVTSYVVAWVAGDGSDNTTGTGAVLIAFAVVSALSAALAYWMPDTSDAPLAEEVSDVHIEPSTNAAIDSDKDHSL